MRQRLVVLDVEGVLTPEIWMAVAKKLRVAELCRTTKDEPDYDTLMRQRIELLDQHQIGLSDIQAVIADLKPLEGATEFLDELRRHVQVVLLSDTFEQFAAPLMGQLSWPTILCHKLNVVDDHILAYQARIEDPKLKAVQAFQGLNYQVIAAGDSYNDISMISAADAGFLFRAPDAVKAEFPDFKAIDDYAELFELLLAPLT